MICQKPLLTIVSDKGLLSFHPRSIANLLTEMLSFFHFLCIFSYRNNKKM